jgi:hypothetical protein
MEDTLQEAWARAYAEGKNIRWCEYHHAQIINPIAQTCLDEDPIYPCRMVEMRLAPLAEAEQ